MTKANYIKNHPKSHLADALRCNTWLDDTEIEIIVGGHRYRGTEGWWMAVA